MSVQYNTKQYKILHNFLVPDQGILLGFSTPEQGGKLKTPVAHTRLIKVEFPLSGHKVWYFNNLKGNEKNYFYDSDYVILNAPFKPADRQTKAYVQVIDFLVAKLKEGNWP